MVKKMLVTTTEEEPLRSTEAQEQEQTQGGLQETDAGPHFCRKKSESLVRSWAQSRELSLVIQ